MSNSLRLLIAHFRPDVVSGAEMAISDFVNRMDKHFQCIMLVPGEGNLSDYYRRNGYQVWAKRIQNIRRRYPGLHTAQSILFALQLRYRKIDLVLSNTFSAASRVGTASRLAHIPHAIYVREYISEKAVHRQIIGKANRILAVSADVRNHLSAFADPAKIVLAYDTIDPKPILDRVDVHRASGIRLIPFGNEHPVVGLVGRITPFKQQDLFVRSIPHVLQAIPEARFVVVGGAIEKDREYEAYVKRLAGESGVQEKVAFMGNRSDAIEITSELSVACMTSTREPLGRVVLEAQLAGIPVVSSDKGGQAELIEAGVTGLLFTSSGGDAEIMLAAQIIRFLKEEELRRILPVKAFEKIHTNFAGLKHVRIIERLLEDCSSGHRVSRWDG